MAAKKTKKVKIEIDVETLVKLAHAAEALSELASANITGVDDPEIRADLMKRAGLKGGKKRG